MLYEVTLYQDFYGVQCINRWNYVRTGTPAAVSGSFALTHAMGFIEDIPTSIFAMLRELQTANVRYVSTSVRAIYAVEDFYERPFTANLYGLNGSESLNPFSAFGLRSTRTRQDIRRATKRFVGVAEADQASGGAVGPVAMNRLQQLSTRMAAVLTYDDEGNTVSFSPCVVHRQKVTSPETGVSYRYFPTLAEQMNNLATGILWEAYPHVRSQVSRQFGRGN